MRERACDGVRDREGLRRRQPAPVLETPAEIFAVDQLHGQKGEPAVLAGSQQSTDVRMVQPARDVRFAEEAPAHLAIGRELRQQALDRDGGVRRRVARAPDLGDAAAAEQLHQLEAPVQDHDSSAATSSSAAISLSSDASSRASCAAFSPASSVAMRAALMQS
jgi:hypothetical protein